MTYAANTRSSAHAQTRRASTAADRWLLGRLQRSRAAAAIRFVLWDGFDTWPGSRQPAATIYLRNRRALAGLLLAPDLHLGEAYMSHELDIEGDLLAMLEEVYRAFPAHPRRVWQSAETNDAMQSRDNVHRHYDLGNDFYRLWLDAEMLYTCAYFPSPELTLEQAQTAKMDLVCRKLHLRPGERVVEAGCGWGGLALFMARRYGASVRAFNLSSEQIAFARERARAEGLSGAVEFVEDDYRNISGTYDAFVSVGMLEHVGLRQYRALGLVIDRVLTREGRGLLHFIGRNHAAPLNRWIRKRIFPGAYPPTLGEVFDRVLHPNAFSVLDVENLRLHYARTLAHWRERFAASSHEVSRMFDDSFVRAWRLYLAGSQAAFTTGWMQLFQVVFARADNNAIPWTRFHEPGAEPGG